MAFLVAEPQIMAAVAADIEGIGSAISAANATAAAPISGLLAAAGDEVSANIANLFAAYGREYQAAAAQVAAFHGEFQRTLAVAASAYTQAEAAGAAAVQSALAPVAPALQGALAPVLPTAAPAAAPAAAMIPPFPANLTTLVMGGTGIPIPGPQFINLANELYVRSMNTVQGLDTPEELYPLTGVKSMTLDASVAEGLTILDNQIQAQLAIPGNTVTVFGVSQSAVIASLEMQRLAAMGAAAPTADQLNFVLTGNEMNPNGGMLARFPNLSIPSLGLTFYGGTPSDTIYPTAIYSLEYDGFASFPQYPLNFISSLNAVMGIIYVHPTYFDLTPAQVDAAIELPTSPGYSGVTSYYMLPTENLPLLEPIRAIPVIGDPIANLVQPNLKVIVNLGYGDPNFGYSTGPADVTTPFGLWPDVPPQVIFDALVAGTHEGIGDFSADMSDILSQPPTLPELTFPTLNPGAALLSAPTPTEVVNTFTKIVSDDYAVLLPAADIALAYATTLPLYNTTLFVDQLAQGNLINAVGFPIAADVGLTAIAGGVGFLVVVRALSDNINDIESLFA
ncbi:PE family protein [Mycobacterium spongiae]|uniref:PE-PPE domain-containing protein n=1 Tax=Mycobacterium spongiae TaxID=886343 RepID=A0A975PYE9_9MYCO|nr:PE-PPE domain-containing protein [Mycobacterium spongiae]QUR68728.1 PE-PPE domain-containing protein [Mycobacterium spongiae]